MNKQFVGLTLLLLCITSDAMSLNALRRTAARATRARASLDLATQSSASAWLDANEEFVTPFMKQLDASLASDKKAAIKQVLGVRGNRFEAALGLALQEKESTKWILRETLHRLICAQDLLRSKIKASLSSAAAGSAGATIKAALEAKGADETKIFRSLLFQIPTLAPHDQGEFVKHDAGRSGAFFHENDAAKNWALYEEVMKGGNVRELLHLFSRATGLGEKGVKTGAEAEQAYKDAATTFPGSFRHILFLTQPSLSSSASTEEKKLLSDLEGQCKFNTEHFKREIEALPNSGKKNIISPLFDDSWVAVARGDDFRVQRSPHGAKAKLTIQRLADLGCPLSIREKSFLTKVVGAKLANEAVDEIPWGVGSSVWNLYQNEGGKGPSKGWTENMLDDGLAVDAGPSGTTDEIMQLGDFFGTTQSVYGACAFRDGAISIMAIFLHHSFGEVCQGAMSYSPATKTHGRPAEIDFEWGRPYHTLATCDSAGSNGPSAVTHSFGGSHHASKAPTYATRVTDALAKMRSLADPKSKEAATIKDSDFGSHAMNAHPFSVADEGEGNAAIFKTEVCDKTFSKGFPGGDLEKRVMCTFQ